MKVMELPVNNEILCKITCLVDKFKSELSYDDSRKVIEILKKYVYGDIAINIANKLLEEGHFLSATCEDLRFDPNFIVKSRKNPQNEEELKNYIKNQIPELSKIKK